jgi:glutamate racemase
VLLEIRAALPAENLLYVADSGAAPYGERSGEFIHARARAIVEFFLEQQVKAIVVACNTATAVAIQSLRSTYSIPMIAIEPAVKPAAARTRSGAIGILATSQTLASEKFLLLAQKHGQGARILTQACPGWVEQVEKGELNNEATRRLVAAGVEPLIAQGADTLVLGCTHFPFLSPVIREVAGADVALIDPSEAVARELRRRLEADGLSNAEARSSAERFWTSGNPAEVSVVVARLWGKVVAVQALPERFAVS